MYKDILKKHNVSVTQKRITLLETLHTIGQPMTIEMLKKYVSSDMDTSTIYRSLKTLVDVGIIYQTDFREGVSYFEFQGEHHHHHVICTECKSRKMIDMCIKENFKSITKKTGYTITNHIFELFGVCKTCLK